MRFGCKSLSILAHKTGDLNLTDIKIPDDYQMKIHRLGKEVSLTNKVGTENSHISKPLEYFNFMHPGEDKNNNFGITSIRPLSLKKLS